LHNAAFALVTLIISLALAISCYRTLADGIAPTNTAGTDTISNPGPTR